LANITTIMVWATVITSFTAAVLRLVRKHLSIDTAAIGVDESVPCFVALAALTLVATFLGVRVVHCAALGLLGVREVRAVGPALVLAAELVVFTAPFVAVERIATSEVVVDKRVRVWVVVGVATCQRVESAAFTFQDANVFKARSVAVHVTREPIVTAIIVIGLDLVCQVDISRIQDVNQLYDLVED